MSGTGSAEGSMPACRFSGLNMIDRGMGWVNPICARPCACYVGR